MLTPVQQHALDRFAKSLLTLADASLIDAYHQVWEDHRDARRWHAGGRARGKEFIGGAGIGPARVRVADVGRKEFEEAHAGATMISNWKQELVKRAGELFARGSKAPAAADAQKVIDDLHRKIGQLQVECDFLAGQPAISRLLRGGR